MDDNKKLGTGGMILGSLLAVLFLYVMVGLVPWIGFYSFVGAGNVGVVTRFGAVQRVANPGIVWKLALFEGVTQMETRTQVEQVDASSASSDLQEVKATVALNFHLRGENAVDVYQNIGKQYKERIIAPAMQEAFKATTAKFTASDLIGRREEVKRLAYDELKTRLEKYNIVVDDFNIVNFDFSKEFNGAIEAKTVAQQNKERATIESQTALIQAQGQADAQKKLQDSGSLTQAYLTFLLYSKWDGKGQPVPLATSGQSLINVGAK